MKANSCSGTILIVDDQPVIIHALSKLLEDCWEVIFSKSPLKALDIIQGKNPPDIILLDINMPEMNGYEVCQRIKQNPETASIPVIFISARDESIDEATGFEVGASDYITKPFQPVVVRARVGNQMQLKQRTDMLESIAHTDALTGIANRRTWDENLQKLWKHCLREAKPLGILMIDIDHFKQYNDSYGHEAGDDCLQAVAKALADCVQRPLEFVARYGGEEFAAILPNTDIEGCKYLAQRMLQAVRETRIPNASEAAAEYISVSIGAAAIASCADTEPLSLVKLADKALYHAKQAGRNRLCVYGEQC